MAVDAAPTQVALLRRSTDGRQPDKRSALDNCRIELDARRHEELIIVRRVAGDSHRILRLIEGGRLAEAHSVAGGLLHTANRRLHQYGLLNPEPA